MSVRCGSRFRKHNRLAWCVRPEGHAGRHCNSSTHVSNVRYWSDEEATAYWPAHDVGADTAKAHELIQAFATVHGVTVDDLTGPGQGRRLRAVRHAAMATIRETTQLSLPAIGRLFGCHHKTVLDAVRRASGAHQEAC